ncbi:MAG: peptidoglycan bridge formation glycyltransferase FemA/FemB family protein [Candidatus Moranbacteria bacterium]|nr:peptidoglycan bridge formation glycyltransferase FemA/FemB family protein [Candidatus Moranbacteria bacterium]
MEKKISDFIQKNSPDGGFLQSEYWKEFQEAWGRNAFAISISKEDGELAAFANIIEHTLPIVGKYFYISRGPVIEKSKIQNFLDESFDLAGKNNIGWVRMEPNSEEDLKSIRENLSNNLKIKKSSVDMQPREILMIDISKGEEEILAGMKQKTRYNIKLADKKGVKIYSSRKENHIDDFCRLVKITSERDRIKSHPESYYRKMFKVIPGDVLKLYVAEYEGKTIVANLVLFFGKTAIYMHGASDNEYRNAMAPHLLQWQAIQDAKEAGCERYDLGGIRTGAADNSWLGITKFKTGFAPGIRPIQFPGCYDIILKPAKYNLYRALQKVKRIF